MHMAHITYSLQAEAKRSKKLPDRTKLQRLINQLKSNGEQVLGLERAQITRYILLTYEAIDSLIQEGYKIQIVRENKPDSIKSPFHL